MKSFVIAALTFALIFDPLFAEAYDHWKWPTYSKRSLLNLNLFSPESQDDVFAPLISVKTAPRTMIVDGKKEVVTIQVISGSDPQGEQSPYVTEKLKSEIGDQSQFPIQKIVFVPDDESASQVAATDLKTKTSNIIEGSPREHHEEESSHLTQLSHSPAPSRHDKDIKLAKLPRRTAYEWFVQHHNTAYSIIRFFLNGTCIGVTLMYAWNVPLTGAMIAGLILGTMSGVIQYNIDAYRAWLKERYFVNKFGAALERSDAPGVELMKKAYNEFLGYGEEYGKWAAIDFTYLSIARLIFGAISTDHFPPGFLINLKSVGQTTGHSILGQGVATLGLFTDVDTQIKSGKWTEEFGNIFKNSTALLLATGSTVISTLRLIHPNLGAELDLFLFKVPVKFLVLTGIGLLFYLHAMLTTMPRKKSS